MHKRLTFFTLLSVFVFATFVFFTKAADAKPYIKWYGTHGDAFYYYANGCVLEDTRTSSSGKTSVYTLKPDYTLLLNDIYEEYWGDADPYNYSHGASCGALQFHVDHKTTVARLRSWIQKLTSGWYSNLKSSPFEGQTISTHRHDFFLIQNGVARPIPDWLTAMSWGLMPNDRYSVPRSLEVHFYKNVKIGAPLEFNKGPYYTQVNSIWKKGLRDYSSLPPRISSRFTRYENLFERCKFKPGTQPEDLAMSNLFDWSWMSTNHGCSN